MHTLQSALGPRLPATKPSVLACPLGCAPSLCKVLGCVLAVPASPALGSSLSCPRATPCVPLQGAAVTPSAGRWGYCVLWDTCQLYPGQINYEEFVKMMMAK
eukprot:296611-Alexandrium_andersonii.AAC.1